MCVCVCVLFVGEERASMIVHRGAQMRKRKKEKKKKKKEKKKRTIARSL